MYEDYKPYSKTVIKEKEKMQLHERVAKAYCNYRELDIEESCSKYISDNVPGITVGRVKHILAQWGISKSEPSFVSMSLSRPLYSPLLGVTQDSKVMGTIMAMMNNVDALTRAYGFFDTYMGTIYTRNFREKAISDSEVIAFEHEDNIFYFAHLTLKRPSFRSIRDMKKRESYKNKWAKIPSKIWLFTWSVPKDSVEINDNSYKVICPSTVTNKFDLFPF